MKIDADKPIPKYLQLKDIIRRYFEEERYQSGQKIPSENELVERFHVSRNTVRQALGELSDEGLIYKKQGLGTFFSGNLETPDLSYLIGVLSPRISYYIYPQIIHGIDEVVHQKRYNIVLGNSYADYKKEIVCLEQLLEKHIDGLLFEPVGGFERFEESDIFHVLNELTIPFVFMDWWFDDPALSCVSVDDVEGGFRATNYLIQAGHRRIACLYPHDKLPGNRRYHGYRKALEQHGLACDDDLIRTTTSQGWDTSDVIEENVRQLLALGQDRPTAIFLFNDDGALRAYNAIRGAGLRVPEDISLIGFDNSKQAASAEVPLTTMNHPKHKVGAWAAEILFDHIEARTQFNPRKILITPIVVEHSSVKFLNDTSMNNLVSGK